MNLICFSPKKIHALFASLLMVLTLPSLGASAVSHQTTFMTGYDSLGSQAAHQVNRVLLYRAPTHTSLYAASRVHQSLERQGIQVIETPLSDLNTDFQIKVSQSPLYAFNGRPSLSMEIQSIKVGDETSAIILAERDDASSQKIYEQSSSQHLPDLEAEAFALRTSNHESQQVYWAFAGDATGLVYAGLDIAQQVDRHYGLNGFIEKTETPAFPFRALKFNLPWSSYRVHESLQLHYETCRDLVFWEKFLDMMAENRFNRLTLWSIHPWTYMVRPTNYPEACGLTDSELAEWQQFWHTLFGMAQERGIKTFMVNWNIYTSPEFSKIHNVATYSQNLANGYNGDGDYSELVQQYNIEVVTQVLNEYPELTGIGVSQNERMKGVPEQTWQNWIVDTYYTAMDSADHDIEFMMRGHTHPAPRLTRAAIEENAERLPNPVWLPLKFNWSHGHATAKLAYIHGGSSSDEWWNPMPTNYKVVFTIRNEDFFVLRWGQPDFIRDMLTQNNQEYVGGFMVGSETYIPAKEFITKPGDHLTWEYAFEKQWLFYKMWGRLLYDPTTPNSVFEEAFDEKYGSGVGETMIKAYTHGSTMPLALASYRASSWDFTLYSEGFLEGAEQTWRGQNFDDASAFLSIEEIIGSSTLDKDMYNIRSYVSRKKRDRPIPEDRITPDLLADSLENHGLAGLALMDGMQTADPTLLHEMADVRAWSYLNLYFAEKLRGGIALEFCRNADSTHLGPVSVEHLEKALDYWDALLATVDPYFDDMPLLHFGDAYITQQFDNMVERFSWKYFRDQVVRDIEIAQECVQSSVDDEDAVGFKNRLNLYPNPIRSSSTLSYELDHYTNVIITVYDVLGRHVRTLVNSNQTAGQHAVQWNGQDESGRSVASGVYFISMQIEGEQPMRQKIIKAF